MGGEAIEGGSGTGGSERVVAPSRDAGVEGKSGTRVERGVICSQMGNVKG